MAGTSKDVCDVMNALQDKGRSENVILLLVQETQDMESICLFCIFTCAGEWSKQIFSNRDIIRLQLACEAMDLEARPSIYYAALNALGKEGVNTNMKVSVILFACF